MSTARYKDVKNRALYLRETEPCGLEYAFARALCEELDRVEARLDKLETAEEDSSKCIS